MLFGSTMRRAASRFDPQRPGHPCAEDADGPPSSRGYFANDPGFEWAVAERRQIQLFVALEWHEPEAEDTWLGSEPRADDGARTRDLRLGKPTLYQLSYVRARPSLARP
jgi:hypothetical protein